jgi:protein TonB
MRGQTTGGTTVRAEAPPTIVQQPGAPVRISGSVMQGLLLTSVQPVYPQEAKKAGIVGLVVLRATISKDGHISSLEAVAGPDALRQAALDAVRQWTYKPYLLNGSVVEVLTTIIVQFK